MSAKLGWGLPLEVSAIHCLGVTDIGLRELVDRGLIAHPALRLVAWPHLVLAR